MKQIFRLLEEKNQIIKMQQERITYLNSLTDRMLEANYNIMQEKIRLLAEIDALKSLTPPKKRVR